MTDEQTTACGPGGDCGYCPSPCFLRGEDDAFNSLIETGPESEYDKLAEAVNDTDTYALGCSRWENPDSDCECPEGNFFCYSDAEAAEQDRSD